MKALDPNLHLKAFTAIEILHLSWVGKRSVPETLAALREAGLGSLTGGGAEIFDPEVREVICHAKETAEEWLDVHRTWHKMGGRSTCTMLIGHVEKDHHRVDHLRRLRELQDETGGFTAFVTLAFHPENTKLAHLPGPSGYDMLQDAGDCAHLSRQFRSHQGVLDSDGHEAGAGVVELRRGRHRRHDHRGKDLSHGRREDAASRWGGRNWCAPSAKRAASRCSGIRCTES